MNIGVLKERKHDERRVALQPCQAGELVQEGHQVWVESGSGDLAQYPDRAYLEAGASIADKKQVLDNCQLLLKVKCPTTEEYGDYRSYHTLFTYLHFDENIAPEKTKYLISSGFLGIAYEWVGQNGHYPLLAPMSQLTGHLFYQRSVELLAEHKGVLAGAYIPSLSGANILIIGMGRIGTEVLKCALLNRLNVTVVARNSQQVAEKVRQIFEQIFGLESGIKLPNVILFDNDNPNECKNQITELMPQLDIIINGAVRRSNLPKDKLEYLIDKSMIAQMQANSIVCDATACDGDFIETCISSESLAHYDAIEQVIHYSPDHIPSYVAKTSTDLLTNATFEYVKLIANLGAKEAIVANESLRNGVSCYQGKITHLYTAEKKGFEYVNIVDLLNA
jgi:alanine dehydrogenase